MFFAFNNNQADVLCPWAKEGGPNDGLPMVPSVADHILPTDSTDSVEEEMLVSRFNKTQQRPTCLMLCWCVVCVCLSGFGYTL